MKHAVLFTATIPILALAIASSVRMPKKLIYNASPSAPTGFYWLDNGPPRRGDYVLVHIPDRVRSLVETRGYLPPDVPLVKRIAGTNGDRICRYEQEIRINGIAVAVAMDADGLGRPMPEWRGCHILHGQRVFLLQDHPRSFDGRYFGPVDRELIISRATRLPFP